MLARSSTRMPKLVIALWLVATAALGAFALHLADEVKAGGFVDSHGSAVAGQQLNEKAFHDPANQLAVVLTASQPLTQDQVSHASQASRAIPGVQSIVDARERADLAARGKRTQVLLVGFRSDNTATQNQVSPLRHALNTAFKGQGVKTSVTGAPALDYDLNMQSAADAMHAEFIAFPLLIVVVLLVYRSLAPTFITLSVAGMALAMTHGIGDLLARSFDVSNMYVTAASLIGLAVSVDYCLFVLKRHEEFVAAGLSTPDAILAASKTAGHAVRFGGIAVIAALCALFISRNMVFASIAGAGIVVTLLAIALTASFVPAVVTLLGERTFWGSFRLPALSRGEEHLRSQPRALRSPRLVTGALVVAMLALAAPLATLVLRVPVASASILPTSADSRVGIEAMNRGLDARTLFPTTVTTTSTTLDGALAASSTIERSAKALPSVKSVVGAGQHDPAREHARAEVARTGTFHVKHVPLVTHVGNSYVSRVMVTATGTPDSSSAHDAVRELRRVAGELPGESFVSGATAQGMDFDDLVEDSIPWIGLIVVAVSAVMLAFAFRSRWLPIVALGLNALVVAAAMGALTAGWRLVTGESINSVTPVVLFAIIFGLSMDYMVLMANRMKEEFHSGRGHEGAIRTGAARTHSLVTSAAIIMIAVFASFLVAKISIVRELGTGLAIAVFFDAFVVRSFLMPAVLKLVGARVWGRPRSNELPGKLGKIQAAPTSHVAAT